MKNLVIFLILLCALWMVGVLFEDKQENDYKFMSVQHTNICRAIAAIIIIQHVSGGFEIRYLTPPWWNWCGYVSDSFRIRAE